MSEDKHKMQADGSGTKPKLPDEAGELASRRARDEQGSESSGRRYPSSHGEGDEEDKSGGFKGGQSKRAYYGHGQLGEKDVGESDNAPSEED